MKRPFAAYQGDEPYVFVCYAHEDAEQVYPEIQRLHEGGVRIWYDEGVSPGTRWTDELASKLTEASVVLFFCTPQSVKRKHCQNELNFAIDKDRPLLVIQDGAVDLPPGMQLQLGAHQSILKHDLSAEQFEAKLTAAISQHLVRGPAPAPAAPKSARSRTRRPLLYVAGVALRCSDSTAMAHVAFSNIRVGSRRHAIGINQRGIHGRSAAVPGFEQRTRDSDIRAGVE